MSGENDKDPVGRGPEWVLIQLAAKCEAGPALAKMEPSVANYRKLAAMIEGATQFVECEDDAVMLDGAHDMVISAWSDFVHDH